MAKSELMARSARATVKAAKEPRKFSGATMDVYIRMGEDEDKDYCFNVPSDAPVSWLYRVFDNINITLSPSYFFYDKPIRFSTSVYPGYLTGEGCLLFGSRAHEEKYLKPLSDGDTIAEVVAEGQLIVPCWPPNNRRWFSVIAFLLGWLYLDLPEFITPTPGTAPSTVLYALLDKVFPTPGNPERSEYFNHPAWQCIFFAMHIAKALIFWIVLWNGVWHPPTLNPLSSSRFSARKKALPNPEKLAEIGFTGVRRTSPSDWHRMYLDHRAKRAGGVVEAYKLGVLGQPMGYRLNEGEGWSVLRNQWIDEVSVGKDLLDSEGKFVVSRQYFAVCSKPLAALVQSKGPMDSESIEKIKEFRQFGYLDGPMELVELFEDLIPMHQTK